MPESELPAYSVPFNLKWTLLENGAGAGTGGDERFFFKAVLF